MTELNQAIWNHCGHGECINGMTSNGPDRAKDGESPCPECAQLKKAIKEHSGQRLREFGEELISEIKATVEWPEDEYFPGLNTACHIISTNLEELGENQDG